MTICLTANCECDRTHQDLTPGPDRPENTAWENQALGAVFFPSDKDGDPTGPDAQAAHLEVMAHDLADVATGVANLNNSATAVEYLGARDTAEVLADVRRTRKALADLEAVLESQVVRKAETEGLREFTLSNGSPVQFMGGTDRKDWDHRGLAYAVVDAVKVDRETGEMADPASIVSRVLDAAAVSYWRVGVLKPLGIQANDYCTKSPGRRTVKISEPDQ